MTTVALGGALAPEDVVGVARAGWKVAFPEDAERRVARARAFVDRLAGGDALVYGITTGVGKLKDVRIPDADRRALQLNLLRSHAAGLGPPMAVAETRAMWCCLAASLARGHSGVRPDLVRLTSGNQEDFVPMGAAAVRKCREVLQRVRAVLGIEAMCAAQALDYRAPLRPGRGSAAAHAALRARVPRLEQDRPLSGDFAAALALIEDGSLLAAVEAAVGGLE